ncbi:MAG TPA: hypothetical protein PKG94_14255 [Gordonia sp. (in: high G+C Gram-positive bacteria)]|nr:hypothetical protein [Gordonia sp. (in: high G+C Gram-positive bacteria)]
MTQPPLLTPEGLTGYLADPADVRVAAVTAYIRARCGWHIAPSCTESVILDGSGTGVVSLRSGNVTTVTSVVENGVDITDEVEWTRLGLMRHPRCWTSRWRSITVTMTHGYPVVPADLMSLVAEVATRLPAPGDAREKKIGPFEYVVGESLFLPHELATIDHYALLPEP